MTLRQDTCHFDLIVLFSQIHVTEAVVACLDGSFDVVPGHGADRNTYLREHDVNTYLIEGGQTNKKSNGLNRNLRRYM